MKTLMELHSASVRLSRAVLPQRPAAIPGRQVSAVRTDADGPDAGPALCRLSVPLFVRVHVGPTFWILQSAGVPVYVDYVQEILRGEETRPIRKRICALLKPVSVFPPG